CEEGSASHALILPRRRPAGPAVCKKRQRPRSKGMAKGARPDPRVYQSAILFGLLLYGGLALDFDVTAGRTAVLVASALATQWVCTRVSRPSRFDPLRPPT